MKVEELTDLERDEYIVILFFTSISGYMFIESFNFRSDVATFPRYTSAFVLICCFLLVFNNFLPETIRNVVVGGESPFERDEFVEDELEESQEYEDGDDLADSQQQEKNQTSVNRPINSTLFSALAMALYVVLGVLIGFLWATPVYVIVYCIWFKQSKIVTLALSFLTFVLAFVFLLYLRLPLDSGILTDMVIS